MKLAPIAFFVYNRPWHTAQTLAALARNEFASESDLLVYADGARQPEHLDSVREVRELCRAAEGFKSVTLIERERNLGLSASIIGGISETLARHDRAVIVEDDLVTSPYFLRFMNEALEQYQDDDRVVSVHGYLYPVRGRLPHSFFIRDTGCWGWATWRRGWELFNEDGGELLERIERGRLSYAFDIDGSYGFTKMLRQHVNGTINTWDIRWQASAFLEGKLTLFPGVSLVNNIGHDNSGTHSFTTDCFSTPLATSPVKVGGIAVQENLEARRLLADYFFGLHKTAAERLAHRALAWLRSLRGAK